MLCVKSKSLSSVLRDTMQNNTEHTSHKKKRKQNETHYSARTGNARLGSLRVSQHVLVTYRTPSKAHSTHYYHRSLGVLACKQGAAKQTTNPQKITAPLHTREGTLSIPSSPPHPPFLPPSLPRVSMSIYGAGRASTRQKIKQGRPGLWC